MLDFKVSNWAKYKLLNWVLTTLAVFVFVPSVYEENIPTAEFGMLLEKNWLQGHRKKMRTITCHSMIHSLTWRGRKKGYWCHVPVRMEGREECIPAIRSLEIRLGPTVSSSSDRGGSSTLKRYNDTCGVSGYYFFVFSKFEDTGYIVDIFSSLLAL
jgi:hypothetical protein